MTLQLNGVNIIRGVGGAIVIERQELKRFFRMKKKRGNAYVSWINLRRSVYVICSYLCEKKIIK